MMLNSKSTLAAALAAGFLIAAPNFALAEPDATPPEAPGEHGDRHPGGGHHGRHLGGPFLRELRSLDLSEAQRSSVRNAVKASLDAGRSQHETLRSLQRRLLNTTPDSAGYAALVNQLADAEANAARDRVQKAAALKGELYAMLTDAQKARLITRLQQLPEPPARSEKTGGKPR
ncbi:MAG: hypothetical protein C0434_01310 [Xanthomonadaceae bacterium]|nr:hypothetical protein [Xanthomonadaceae bacterium]